MKHSHRIFFAIPFDSATSQLYREVTKRLRQRYKTLSTIIGNKEIGPSPVYSKIASFKAQNRELTEQFVSQIQQADIVVADLTHNNPNVHVELGIALFENKNILRVTGRSLTELGFDIRNLEARRYSSEEDLVKMLTDYVDLFFKIKRLPFSSRFPELYSTQGPLELRAAKMGVVDLRRSSGSALLRDGAVKAKFNFLTTLSSADWFGIYFRGAESNPLLGSQLVYVRQNGTVEVATYPGPVIFKRFSLGRAISRSTSILIEFENDHLNIRIGKSRFETRKLSVQNAGGVFFAAWQANVDVATAEIICRDTIDLR
jgi:nucleoside 2-deoxyribosyltransferase